MSREDGKPPKPWLVTGALVYVTFDQREVLDALGFVNLDECHLCSVRTDDSGRVVFEVVAYGKISSDPRPKRWLK